MSKRPAAAKPKNADDIAWQDAGDEGADVVRQALGRRALDRLNAGKGGHLLMAFGFGGIAAAAEFLAGMTKPTGKAAIEQWAIGYVRAAIRGEKGPVHDDGRPMTGAFDA